jgi:hypothetical protein
MKSYKRIMESLETLNIAMVAAKQYWVLITFAKSATGSSFINHVQNYLASWSTCCTPNIPSFSPIGICSRGDANAMVAIERIYYGASVTIVLTVILALKVNVLLYHSPTKLKFIMHTH